MREGAKTSRRIDDLAVQLDIGEERATIHGEEETCEAIGG